MGAIEFSYYGTPEAFIRLIVDNTNAEDSEWYVGTCEVLDDINIDLPHFNGRELEVVESKNAILISKSFNQGFNS